MLCNTAAQPLRYPVSGPVPMQRCDVRAAMVAVIEQQQLGRARRLLGQPRGVLPRDESVELAHDDEQRATDRLGAAGQAELVGGAAGGIVLPPSPPPAGRG